MRGGKSRLLGMTLGVVMLVIFACLTFAFGLAGMCTLHINMVARLVAETRARDLAESAMAIALAKVMETPAFGQTQTDPTQSIVLLDSGNGWTEQGTIAGARMPNPAYPGEALLTFDTGAAATLKMPYSVNNVAQNHSTMGWDGRTIPASTLHVTSMAQEGTEQFALEALIGMPPFPYSLAASGTIVSEGQLLAASVQSSPCLNPYHLTPCQTGPADLGSNSSCPCNAVVLGPAVVGGDVNAVGGISVSACTVVKGAVQPHHAPIPLPFIFVPGQFIELCEYASVQTITSVSGPLTGRSICKKDLNVSGPLVLNEGILYVQGNLTVTGGIQGVGAIFVEGSCTIGGCSTLTTDDVCALVAAGPITLSGSSQASSFFQGIVYSSSSIMASNLTVLGSMVVNTQPMPPACSPMCPVPKCAPPVACGNITLQNVSVISDSAMSRSVCTTHTGCSSHVVKCVPPAEIKFGNQKGVGAGTFIMNLWTGDQGCFCAGFWGSGTVGGCALPLGQCCLSNRGCRGETMQYHVTPIQCTPCGPITKVHLKACVCIGHGVLASFFGCGSQCFKMCSTWCYPMDKCEVHKFMQNCVNPPVQFRQDSLITCLFGCAPCTLPCVESHAGEVSNQIFDIVSYHSNCSFTTQQVQCNNGYMFYMSLNQFLGLDSQMRVLYWAAVDPRTLEGPPSGDW